MDTVQHNTTPRGGLITRPNGNPIQGYLVDRTHVEITNTTARIQQIKEEPAQGTDYSFQPLDWAIEIILKMPVELSGHSCENGWTKVSIASPTRRCRSFAREALMLLVPSALPRIYEDGHRDGFSWVGPAFDISWKSFENFPHEKKRRCRSCLSMVVSGSICTA